MGLIKYAAVAKYCVVGRLFVGPNVQERRLRCRWIRAAGKIRQIQDRYIRRTMLSTTGMTAFIVIKIFSVEQDMRNIKF